MSVMRALFALLALLAAAVSAHAVDGIAEINHVCAAQTGCFSGDTAGYPVTIDGSAGGSYRLTSDLIVPNANTHGIYVQASDVGIDLNRFTIARAGCEGATTSCTPAAGTGVGIERENDENRGISVENGNVVGMGRYGVRVGEQGSISRVHARWNRLDGFWAGKASTVTGNVAFENGAFGFRASSGSTVSGNIARGNGANGISVSAGSSASGNTAEANGGDGISSGAGVVLVDNVANNNAGSGIVAPQGVVVRGNAMAFNGAYGLDGTFATGYRENAFFNNGLGTVDEGIDLGANVCQGGTACP